MKKIDLEEEFSMQGYVWNFSLVEGKIKINRLRQLGSRPKSKNPTQEEVTAYFTQHGYAKSASIDFFNWYSDPDNPDAPWKNRDGKVVKDWKRTARQVWFREDNKAEKSTEKKKIITAPDGAKF